ncbi:MAG TPA: hypothetical protein VG537_02885 [Candidatus Kapabacteria bacterium]|jgi:hypothetical protein|nr:hypothetical protein [Candidatus Kapabacteria bacterium]
MIWIIRRICTIPGRSKVLSHSTSAAVFFTQLKIEFDTITNIVLLMDP